MMGLVDVFVQPGVMEKPVCMVCVRKWQVYRLQIPKKVQTFIFSGRGYGLQPYDKLSYQYQYLCV